MESFRKLTGRSGKTGGFQDLPNEDTTPDITASPPRDQDSPQDFMQDQDHAPLQDISFAAEDYDQLDEEKSLHSKKSKKSSHRSKSRKKEKKDKKDQKDKLKSQRKSSKSYQISSKPPTKMITLQDVQQKVANAYREEEILQELRKELICQLAKRDGSTKVSFDNQEQIQQKYENQMLKTKLAVLDSKINELAADGKKEEENYKQMKIEIKELKRIMKERGLIDVAQPKEPVATSIGVQSTPDGVSKQQTAVLSNFNKMMSNNVKEKKFRDGPLTPYFSDDSNKNVIYRS